MRDITREEWAGIIREYQESGESCRSFCLGRDIPFGALRRRLAEVGRKRKGDNPVFIELTLTPLRELVPFGLTLSNGCVVSVPQESGADSLVRLPKTGGGFDARFFLECADLRVHEISSHLSVLAPRANLTEYLLLKCLVVSLGYSCFLSD